MKFTNIRCLNSILNAFKKKRAPLNGPDFNLGNDIKLVIGEHLSADQNTLLKDAKKQLLESKLCNYVWVQNNEILVRQSQGLKSHYIRSIDDIARLVKSLSMSINIDSINVNSLD